MAKDGTMRGGARRGAGRKPLQVVKGGVPVEISDAVRTSDEQGIIQAVSDWLAGDNVPPAAIANYANICVRLREIDGELQMAGWVLDDGKPNPLAKVYLDAQKVALSSWQAIAARRDIEAVQDDTEVDGMEAILRRQERELARRRIANQ